MFETFEGFMVSGTAEILTLFDPLVLGSQIDPRYGWPIVGKRSGSAYFRVVIPEDDCDFPYSFKKCSLLLPDFCGFRLPRLRVVILTGI